MIIVTDITKIVTKNLEVRYCDSFHEMMQKAKELHREYYNEDGVKYDSL